MTWASDLFGTELVTKTGNASTESVLAKKKVIAVYFSAHWVRISAKHCKLIVNTKYTHALIVSTMPWIYSSVD